MKLHSYIDIIRYCLLTFQMTLRQTVELKQVEEGGREEGGQRGGNKYNFSAGVCSGGRVTGWLVVTLAVAMQLHSLYGQQLLYQAIANHHLAAGAMADWDCTGKTDTGLPCHSIYHQEGKEKIILFCWSAS